MLAAVLFGKMTQTYSPSFEKAVRRVHYAEDPSGRGIVTEDQGGVTRWGISQRANPDVDVANLTKDQATAIYWERYWLPFGCEWLPEPVASQWFLFAVNVGPDAARRLLQRAVQACGKPIKEDGAIGNVTLNAIDALPADALCAALRSEYAGHVRLLATMHPERHGSSLSGWLRRAYEY